MGDTFLITLAFSPLFASLGAAGGMRFMARKEEAEINRFYESLPASPEIGKLS